MIALGIMGLMTLAFSNLIQSQMRSIAVLEDKLSAVDLENLVNRIISDETACRNSFLNANLSAAVDIPVLRDSANNELPSNYDYLIIRRISLTPLTIPASGGQGYANLMIELERTRAQEHTLKPIEKNVAVFTDSSRRITACNVTNPDFLTGEAPIANSTNGTYTVHFPAGFFTDPPSNITVTPKWARFTGDEDTTWWVENVSITSFDIRWKGPGSGGNTPGTDGVYWRADK